MYGSKHVFQRTRGCLDSFYTHTVNVMIGEEKSMFIA